MAEINAAYEALTKKSAASDFERWTSFASAATFTFHQELHLNLRVDYLDLILGKSFKLKIDNKDHNIVIKPNSQNNQTMSFVSAKTTYVIRLVASLPGSCTSKEKELLTQLRKERSASK